jgi:hypothetical protein
MTLAAPPGLVTFMEVTDASEVRVIVGDALGIVRVLRLSEGGCAETARLARSLGQAVTCGSVSPCGRLAAVGLERGEVVIHQVEPLAEVARRQCHKDSVYSIAFVGTCRYVVSVGLDGRAVVLELPERMCCEKFGRQRGAPADK